ncbi:hypothetical protein BU26DRAFT_515208 [Trematosphaeria pertusa]|uniref:Heterokaryon incompatibility domain-containing protein n=1 Tax=Trematosphaeria pertusa TaxID=390896 RepID=A0A6A6IRP3_9PLEO|nr:uncharacterized protein BU26DRAFT_515208 [Trematosphaeria pertusa]KAF2252748.1 hypothetical protein BU26DRAFT_515208 [Trematosphaeria pertusa]
MEPNHEAPLDPNVFCLYPWLFRLYGKESGYIEAATDEPDSLPILAGRKTGHDTPKQPRLPQGRQIYPSRLVSPYMKVEAQDRTLAVPEYTVISYTWGRWMLKDRGQDTTLAGCHWKIPATSLFSRQQLETAALHISGGHHFWLDVFCIPQDDDDPEKAREIQKQGDIFANASRAAVWLCSGGEDVLRDICSWTDPDFVRPALRLAPTAENRMAEETTRRLRVIRSIRTAIPWTTSLWTLQETALRRDAVFHDRDGVIIAHPETGLPLIVDDLVRSMTQIEIELRIFSTITSWMNAEDRELFDSATQDVQAIAIGHLDNMNARELYLASRYRVCQREHDRVYAIMNALSVSIPVDYKAPVELVKREFNLALWRKYPAEMQSYLTVLTEPLDLSLEFGLAKRSLSQMRQMVDWTSSATIFSDFTSDGYFVVSGALFLRPADIDDICDRITGWSAAICFDDRGQARSPLPEHVKIQQRRTAANLRCIADFRPIVLIPLGRLEATSHTGPNFAYVLCISNKVEQGSKFLLSRIGLLVVKEALVAQSMEMSLPALFRPDLYDT